MKARFGGLFLLRLAPLYGRLARPYELKPLTGAPLVLSITPWVVAIQGSCWPLLTR